MKKLLVCIACALFCISSNYAQNKESMLNLKERQIAAISGSAAKGDKPGLTTALTAGLDAGLSVNEIKEVLVQLYAYCGFPRSMGALNTFIGVLQERKARGINDAEGALPTLQEVSRSVEYGAANQRKLFGRDAHRERYWLLLRQSTNTSKHIFLAIFSDVIIWIGRQGNWQLSPCLPQWRV